MMERQTKKDETMVKMKEENIRQSEIITEMRRSTSNNSEAIAAAIKQSTWKTSQEIESNSEDIKALSEEIKQTHWKTSKEIEWLKGDTNAKFEQMAIQFSQLMTQLQQGQQNWNEVTTQIQQGQHNGNEVTTVVATTLPKSKRIQASSPSHPDSSHHEGKRQARQQQPTDEITVPTILETIFNPNVAHAQLTDATQEDDQTMQDTQENNSSQNGSSSDEESSTKSEGSDANVMNTQPIGSQES
jgi:hypothetical protein